MNKTIKYSISILICIFMLFSGCVLSEHRISENKDYNLIEIAYNHSPKFDYKKRIAFELAQRDLFLETYIYGQWRFAERLFTLNQENNIFYGSVSNFSSEGVETIKKAIVVSFSDNNLGTIESIGQNSFSDVRDLYLFSEYGGFSTVYSPEYQIEELETPIVNLADNFYGEGCEVPLFGIDNLIQVNHRSSHIPPNYTIHNEQNFFSIANAIYVNPNDENTIYVDFCGLWKMERDDAYYGPPGKSAV